MLRWQHEYINKDHIASSCLFKLFQGNLKRHEYKQIAKPQWMIFSSILVHLFNLYNYFYVPEIIIMILRILGCDCCVFLMSC